MFAATVASALCASGLTQAQSSSAQSQAGSAVAAATTPAPIGDLPGWRQIFVDDFSTAVPLGSFPGAVSSKWGAYPSPFKDSSGHGTYSPGTTVSVGAGVLNEYLHTAAGTAMVAALLPKLPGTVESGQIYGRYAVRWRTDILPGYKMAWMLWPDSGGGALNGEIDFPERNLDLPIVHGFVHHTNATIVGDQDSTKATIDGTLWHTTVIEWSPNLVVFTLDGVVIKRATVRVPNTAMHWVLQTETRINPPGVPDPTVNGNVQIDWVAAWAYDPALLTATDVTRPVVSVTSITNGDVVAGSVPLTATATDSTAVAAVKWYVDGKQVGYDPVVAPWAANWDSTTMTNGTHVMRAKARDSAGNWGTSPAVKFTVAN